MRTNIISILLVVCWLSGCQVNTASISFQDINEAPFPGFQEVIIESPEDLFALSPEARAFVDEATKHEKTKKRKVQALMSAIFSHTNLDLRYAANANTTATETFENRSANCLSLTIMTYAMIDYLGYRSVFQDVQIPEYWTIRNGHTIVNAHINLRVKSGNNENFIIDFDPQPEFNDFAVIDIPSEQLIALFYNNIAAEYLLEKEHTLAFAYLKEAIDLYPNNAGSWLNLGAVFSQKDELESAIESYETALLLDPDFNTAYDNLAILHEKMGNNVEADEIQARMHARRIRNPYYHMMLAEHALIDTDPKQAILHYKKALRLDKNPHQFHFGLARAYSLIGDNENAEKSLKMAIRRANGKRITEKYNRKLSLLAQS